MASERRHAPPPRAPVADAQVLLIFEAGQAPAMRSACGGGGAVGGEVSSSSSRERCAHVARARHPKKRGGGSPRGEGVGVCARQLPFFPPFHLL